MNLLPALLNGFSQVFLQENQFFGALIAVGLAIASPISFGLGLVGFLASVITAHLLGVKNTILNSGLYSFNGLLIGVVVFFYIKNITYATTLTIIASIFAALLFYFMSKSNIPAFTTPFVLVGWTALILSRFLIK